jgi:hypothetical protein
MPTREDFLALGDRIRVLPIVHGSGDFAIRVREEMLSRSYDCLAVPLPPSFQAHVEDGVRDLPLISAVVQRELGEDRFSYVPIDPCQGVIAGLRVALGERIRREFIDFETENYEPIGGHFPDPYALKKVSVEGFAAAVLPTIPRPSRGQQADRVIFMARRLRELEKKYQAILFICNLLDWPWVRQAYVQALEIATPDAEPERCETHLVDPRTLIFFLGELPFITALYEQGRRDLSPDDNLSVDGVKQLILEARDQLKESGSRTALQVTPQLLGLYFRYVRNLSLIDHRLTPDLYILAVAAQQMAGDDFALTVAEVAREYSVPLIERPPEDDQEPLRMGDGRADVPGFGIAEMLNRLPGQVMQWRSFQLRPRPSSRDRQRWQHRWDPYHQCSWPPEDQRIESFQRHVAEQAKAIMGADLARTEKFTTSVMDGLDIRETLRNWHTGDIYVKIVPPTRGSIEVVVFLFDVPANPRRYPFRATWYAEHQNESTLCYFATDPFEDLIGPGIARAEYGGAMFVYPPRPIADIWTDPDLRFAQTLEERLIAGACLHSREKHVAIVSPKPPQGSWRRTARRFGRKLVHLPLKRFSGQLVQRLRTFHILNGRQVRSYAADFIRDQ